MILHRLPLKDAVLVDAEPFQDYRGLFARLFCLRELEEVLGERKIVNVNFSRTLNPGAIRGLHFQRPPHQEMKFVRCVRGKVYDVIVDIRQSSPGFLSWHGEMLSANNMKMLCVPEGFAHGFQTIEENSEVLYLTTSFHVPDSEGGIRYDDPLLGIDWPLDVTDVSVKDSLNPLLGPNPDLMQEK